MRRRRIDETNGHGPPDTLISYPLWCTRRRRRAYGDPKRPDTMTAARESWEAWEALRQTWARQHDMAVIDVPMTADSDEPWDGSGGL
jgi:hypothetical protein